MNSLYAYMPQDNQDLFRKGLKAGLWMDESFDWYPEEDMMSHPNGEIRTLSQTYTQGQVTFSKFTIRNTSFETKRPKVFFTMKTLSKGRRWLFTARMNGRFYM
ncbi:hypothetical protein Q5O89_24790 [Peribacillus frigoritolerans]|nr:hypothetical protein [Peribacillus frigoritolerans]